ncbi:tyrosine-type recombinase/integrase [Falsihalocynthiibacter sp. S25ZX9]
MQAIRKSKSFEKRVDAKDWAAHQEFLILEGEVSGSTETMRDALLRYARCQVGNDQEWHWRSVPLSTAAVALLKGLPNVVAGGACFALTSANLDVLFRRVRDRAGIKNLTFHDSRHEAITRMASKLDVLSMARVVGHRDIRMLQISYNETAEQLAQRLG